MPGKFADLQKKVDSNVGSIEDPGSGSLDIVTSNNEGFATPPYFSKVDLNLLMLNDIVILV
jgi:hypothetical protein